MPSTPDLQLHPAVPLGLSTCHATRRQPAETVWRVSGVRATQHWHSWLRAGQSKQTPLKLQQPQRPGLQGKRRRGSHLVLFAIASSRHHRQDASSQHRSATEHEQRACCAIPAQITRPQVCCFVRIANCQFATCEMRTEEVVASPLSNLADKSFPPDQQNTTKRRRPRKGTTIPRTQSPPRGPNQPAQARRDRDRNARPQRRRRKWHSDLRQRPAHPASPHLRQGELLHPRRR